MTRPHATMIVGTTLTSLVKGEKPHEENDHRTPPGWSKELEDDISACAKVISHRENMLLRLTTGLLRDNMESESVFVMP